MESEKAVCMAKVEQVQHDFHLQQLHLVVVLLLLSFVENLELNLAQLSQDLRVVLLLQELHLVFEQLALRDNFLVHLPQDDF